ncbi:LuxR family transcriptional regulator [Streptomyces sp. JJ38]|uniref:helix-turn-helix transcriptional regulator n=1 Tax=Streptomyces sp. JJ38 TaxID=2738128 RepID=UPI001C598457|nr:LuxR family transcriptional regulator [Streptomyces sp. JJ38]MBW1595777.1 AAA family ATPase [Streptomyces sp. JJ38]
MGFGRWEERARATLAAAAAGRPALVLVEGEAGSGKSSLVRRLAGPGRSARGVRQIRFSSFETVVQPVGQGAPGASAEQPPPAPVGAAPPVGAPPATRETPAAGEPRTAGDPPGRVYPLGSFGFAELSALTRRQTGESLLLVAEDVHRADPLAQEALRRLLTHPPGPLCTVLTFRPEELAVPGVVLGERVDYPADMVITRVRLEPLDEDEVAELARQALGRPCSEALAEQLHRRSGGVPQVVLDLLAEAGAEAGPDGPGGRDVEQAGPPARLTELVLGRAAELGEAERLVLAAAAVLEEGAGVEELATIAVLSEATVRDALTTLLRVRFVRQLDADRYGFRVPLAADAVSASVPGPLRQLLHRRAAEVLPRRQPVPLAQLARHQLASGQMSAWVDSVTRAAEEAAEAGAHQWALDLLQEALAQPALPEPDRGRLALLLGRSADRALSTHETARLLRHVVEDLAMPTAARGEIRLELGLLLLNQLDRTGEAREQLATAAEELDDAPALAVRAMAALGAPMIADVPIAESHGWMARAEAAAIRDGGLATRTAVAANRIGLLMAVGDAEAWRELERLPRDSGDPKVLHHCARALCNAAHGALWLGEHAKVPGLMNEALQLAVKSATPYVDQLARANTVHADWLGGAWEGLPERVRAVVQDAGRMPMQPGEVELVAAMIALARGEWSRLDTWLDNMAAHGANELSSLLLAMAGAARIRLALARDDVPEAAREAAEVWGHLRTKGVWAWAAAPAPWAVEATARSGRPDVARQMVAQMAEGLEGLSAPWAQASVTWSRGVLAEAEGEPGEAVGHYRGAAEQFERLPHPYEAALTAEAAGRVALAARASSERRPGEATGAADGSGRARALADLHGAQDGFERLRATWDLARVRTLLREHQGATPHTPGRRAYGDRLSPREHEVARLAATGLTNREIAATLHLSPRTVEQHVARAMRKLGARSRGELSRATAPDRD